MTSNAGTEYINLKAAKYSRDVRVSEMSVQQAAHSGVSYSNTAVKEKSYTAGDLARDIAKEIGIAIQKKRVSSAKERAERPVYVKKYVKAQKAVPVSLIGYIIVFSVMAMFLVLGNSNICEATLKVDALQREINAEINRGEILNTTLAQKTDVGYIEDYAVNVLGMVKSTEVAKTYVSVCGTDRMAVNTNVQGMEGKTVATLTLDSVR